jgi:hypothetical protein
MPDRQCKQPLGAGKVRKLGAMDKISSEDKRNETAMLLLLGTVEEGKGGTSSRNLDAEIAQLGLFKQQCIPSSHEFNPSTPQPLNVQPSDHYKHTWLD